MIIILMIISTVVTERPNKVPQSLSGVNKEQIHLKIERLLMLKNLQSQKSKSKREEIFLKRKIEKDLFPWIKISLRNLRKRYQEERGIVMSTGNKYFSMTVHCIRIIRDIHNCHLPIEIFYMGNGDLDRWKVEWIESNFALLKMVDLSCFVGKEHPNLRLEGWDIKPFSVVFSSFKKALFVDSDVVFMKDPLEVMWMGQGREEEFHQTGALFFHDRLIGGPLKGYNEFYERLFYGNETIPIPDKDNRSKNIKDSRIFNGISAHEMDSGLLLIDKERHFWGILAILILNSLPERKEMHRWTWGDKETFWLGLELMGESYTWLDERAGNIGEVVVRQCTLSNGCDSINGENSKITLCGHMAHFDFKGSLLWFQDGIVRDKKRDPRFQLLHPLHTSRDGGWDSGYCSNGSLDPLSPDELDLLERIRGIWDWNPAIVN